MTMTAEARREAVEKAMQAFAEPGSAREAIQLPYKDGQGGPYPVINVPVDAVLFNPRSHRIKAQLESHPERQLVADDPYGDRAQAVIHEILAATEGFEPLKGNLSEYGQREPGVVTREGLLVNANTRLAALRDLGIDYVRAALLPSDADEHAIDRLELELQVQRDFKQDYTFTNELIFINELLNTHGYSEEKAAKALNWAASRDEKELKRGIDRVRQAVRLYASVRYIQSLSQGAIPLTFFDEKRQALIDLDDKYEALKDSDPEGAEHMKNARIVGIISGNFYRELRRIDGDTAVDVLLNRLGEKEVIGDDVDALTAPSPAAGDDGGPTNDADLLDPAEATMEEEPDLLPLVTLMAKSYGQDEIELPSGKTVAREALVAEVAESLEEAAEEAQAIDKFSKNIKGPIKNLDDAVTRARAAAVGYQQVHEVQGFDHGKFKYHTNKLRTQVAALEKLIEQHET
jgi:hypothetical protein